MKKYNCIMLLCRVRIVRIKIIIKSSLSCVIVCYNSYKTIKCYETLYSATNDYTYILYILLPNRRTDKIICTCVVTYGLGKMTILSFYFY